MNQIPNEILAVLIAEAMAFLWFIVKIDKKLALVQLELKYIKKSMGIDDTNSGDL